MPLKRRRYYFRKFLTVFSRFRMLLRIIPNDFKRNFHFTEKMFILCSNSRLHAYDWLYVLLSPVIVGGALAHEHAMCTQRITLAKVEWQVTGAQVWNHATSKRRTQHNESECARIACAVNVCVHLNALVGYSIWCTRRSGSWWWLYTRPRAHRRWMSGSLRRSGAQLLHSYRSAREQCQIYERRTQKRRARYSAATPALYMTLIGPIGKIVENE